MSNLDDFYSTLGYELPSNIVDAVAGEASFQFYKHKAGFYKGFVGKLVPRYKDMEGKKCESTIPGATLSHFNLTLWLVKYLGTADRPEEVQILNPDLTIPEGDLRKFYVSHVISILPKDQWRNHRTFDTFMIPNHENSKIVQPNPADPSTKVTLFKNFPFYYGLPVNLTIEESTKRADSTFVTSVTITDYSKRVPKDLMQSLEQQYETRLQIEMEERKSRNNSTPEVAYNVVDPSSVDFDALAGMGSSMPSTPPPPPPASTENKKADNPLAGFF